MVDFRKAKVTMNVAYKNGDILKQDYDVPARVSVLPIPTINNFKELNLRLVVEEGISEELLEGLCQGVVTLSIEQIPSISERP